MTLVQEFGSSILATIDQRVGVRTKTEAYTEVVFRGQKSDTKDRPDGLLILKTGKREWRALIEAKVGNNPLQPEQVERYRQIAKDHGVDCVITISNQFATAPMHHPVEEIRKSKSRIPVFHWSWMFIRTQADLLLSNQQVVDDDQQVLLKELLRFLTHESAGIKGFERMPPEWTELNRLVAAGGKIPAKSPEAATVINAWHQETKDLSLILSRETETIVQQKLPRKFQNSPMERQKEELRLLREDHRLKVSLDIPDAASSLEVFVDLNRKAVEVGMSLRAPEDRVSSKARVNWLLRQLKLEDTNDVFVRLNWPGRSEDTTFALGDLKETPELCETDKNGLAVVGFHVYVAKQLGGRFTQQVNFISDLETLVPNFYSSIGQDLVAWRKPPPRIREAALEQEGMQEEEG